MAYMYAVPAIAVISAAIILREQVHLMQALGAVVIFLGISMIRKDKIPAPENNWDRTGSFAGKRTYP
jgi:drug/metabolite transporter (DMT)-like permease